MSESDFSLGGQSPQPAAQEPTGPAILLRAQYVKDLSFENPRAPASIFSLREPPAMDVNVSLGAQRLDAQVFELVIQISLRAIAEKATVFLSDLSYAGVLELRNIPDAGVEPAVFVQGAQLLYPFARRVVADVTRDGGFPPLQLEPLDFLAMYNDQRAKGGSSGL
ncbi:MAG: protein-export chaperone SecB [Alphaproteobacteria bacterium]